MGGKGKKGAKTEGNNTEEAPKASKGSKNKRKSEASKMTKRTLLRMKSKKRLKKSIKMRPSQNLDAKVSKIFLPRKKLPNLLKLMLKMKHLRMILPVMKSNKK